MPLTSEIIVSRRTQEIISNTSTDADYISSIRSLLLERDLNITDIDVLTVSEIKAAIGHDFGSFEHAASIAHISVEIMETASDTDPSCSVYNLRNLFKDIADIPSALCVWRNSRTNIHSLRAHLTACSPDISLLAQLSGSMHISDALLALRVLRKASDTKNPALSLDGN